MQESPRPRSITYRADIDGLRAIAVMVVVLYHAGVPGFSGGYVGVDVFFVISGFLITSIIASELDAQQFSIAVFYKRRILRIFPALFSMTLATGIVAAFIFLPTDFKSFGSSVVATALFASNILFWRQNGYFDAPAELKPLLHTWSLSIEEQFYVVFPITLVLLWHLRADLRLRLIAVAAFLSFVTGVWASARYPEAGFYLLPMRAWELLIGALVALRCRQMVHAPAPARTWVCAAGLFLIGIAATQLSEATTFPGVAALLPVMGAALIVWGSPDRRSLVGRLLASRPFVILGQISYSLYLWHWPVIALLSYALARDIEGIEIPLAIAVSMVFAHVSWRFIELPFRNARTTSRARIFGTAVAGTAGLILIGAGLIVTGGIPQRLPPQLLLAAGGISESDPRRVCRQSPVNAPTEPCLVGAAATPLTFAVIGDSHAEAILPAFDLAAQRAGKSGLVFIRHSCRPILGVTRIESGVADQMCSEFVEQTIAEIHSHRSITHVVFVARWSRQVTGRGYGQSDVFYIDAQSPGPSMEENRLSFARGLMRVFDSLPSHRVTLIGSVPEHEFSPPRALSMAALFGRNPPETSLADFRSRNASVREVLNRLAQWYTFEVVSPAQQLCDAESCITEIGGRSLYRDDDHLNAFGAKYIASLLDKVFALHKGTLPARPVIGKETTAVVGGLKKDVLAGSDNKDLLKGGEGDDILHGRGGDDHIFGGEGSDLLLGEKGADRFIYESIGDSGEDHSTRDTIIGFSPRDGDRIDLSLLGLDAGNVYLSCSSNGQLVTVDDGSDSEPILSILVLSTSTLQVEADFLF